MYEFLATSAATSGSSTTITFAGLSIGAYDSIHVSGVMAGTAQSTAYAYLTLNSVTTTTYGWNVRGMENANAAPSNGDNNNASNQGRFGRVPGSNLSGATIYASVNMDIWGHRGTSAFPGRPAWLCQGGFVDTVSASYVGWGGGYNNSISTPISDIKFVINNGTWAVNTQFHLYGRTTS